MYKPLFVEMIAKHPGLAEELKLIDKQVDDIVLAYEQGWRAAALWANRPDLISDINSPAYLKELSSRSICRAYQASDQMVCECGNAWDMNDFEPPECRKK